MSRKKSVGEKLRKIIRIHDRRRVAMSKLPTAFNVSERVKDLLKFYGVSRMTMAKMLRVSESSLSRWVNGKNTRMAHRLLTFHLLEEIMVETRGALRKEGTAEWFNTENECLGGISPVECIIKYPDGFSTVKNLVGRIKYGIPS